MERYHATSVLSLTARHTACARRLDLNRQFALALRVGAAASESLPAPVNLSAGIVLGLLLLLITI